MTLGTRHMRSLLPICAIGLLFLLAAPASADRYHVRSGGQRLSGASMPGNWDHDNCYPDIVTALAKAAVPDSMLLYREAHDLKTDVTAMAFVGNMDLDSDPDGCIVAMSNGQFRVAADCSRAVFRGLTFKGDQTGHPFSALLIDNSSVGIDSVLVRGCVFMDLAGGYQLYGGAGLRAYYGNGMTLMVDECSFLNCVTDSRGSAVRISDGFEAIFTRCTFTDNTSAVEGGALFVSSPGTPTTLTLQTCTFDSNRSSGPGGALSARNCSLALLGTRVLDSHSAWDAQNDWAAGAGVFMRRDEGTHTEPIFLTVEDSEFIGNRGNLSLGPWSADGGGLLVRGSPDRLVSVSVSDSEFRENYNGQGAGLYFGRFATGTVDRCRFHDNTAYHAGGGSYKGGALPATQGETAVYSYCEFVGNRAGYLESGQPVNIAGTGGAFTTRHYPRAEFYNCTFLDNVAGGSVPIGDAVYHYNEGIEFGPENRCVLVNCAFWGEGNNVQIWSNSQGFDRVERCAWPADEFYCPNVTPIDEIVLETFPFESPTDLQPHVDSPLLDTGLDLGPTVDLAGQPVPQGFGAEIGAYEREAPYMSAPVRPTPAPVLNASPNPFNPRVRLSIDLPASVDARLRVMDARGRLVRILFEGSRSAGILSRDWDGYDGQGRAAAAGVYFAVAEFGDVRAVTRVALVR